MLLPPRADVRFVTPVGLSLHKVVDDGVALLEVEPKACSGLLVCRCQNLAGLICYQLEKTGLLTLETNDQIYPILTTCCHMAVNTHTAATS